MEQSNREITLAVMVEDLPALAEIDAIAATEGIDIVAVGPSDMSRALGVGGTSDHPKLVEVIHRVAEAVRKGGVARLALPMNHATFPRNAAQLRELGVGYTQLRPVARGADAEVDAGAGRGGPRARAEVGPAYRDPLIAWARKTAFRSFVGTVSRTHVNPPASFISRAPLRNAARARRDSAPPTLMRLTPASASWAWVMAGSAALITTFSGLPTARTTVRIVGMIAKPRRVEHVRAGLFEGLQPPDRVVEVEAPVQEVLRPRGQHEWHGQRPARLDRGLDALDGEREVVDRVLRVSGRVLDRAADDPRLRRPAGSSRPRRGARRHSRSRDPRSRAGRSRRR